MVRLWRRISVQILLFIRTVRLTKNIKLQVQSYRLKSDSWV